MHKSICKVISLLSFLSFSLLAGGAENDLSLLIEKEGSAFYFGKGKIPYVHHDHLFGKEKIGVLLEEMKDKTKTYFGQLGDYKSYACTHLNSFKEGVAAEMHRAMVIPLKNISSPDPLRWAMDRITGHVTSPAGKPLLGNLNSYIYQFDDSGKLTGSTKYEDNEVGGSVPLNQTVVVKYCLDLPFIAQKCNTIEHKLVRIDADTEVLFSVLVDPKVRSDEGPIFKVEALRRNTNDSGSGMIILKKVGSNIIYVELSKFLSSQKNTVSEFKMFDKKISRDQCEKNSSLLATRLNIQDLKWADLF